MMKQSIVLSLLTSLYHFANMVFYRYIQEVSQVDYYWFMGTVFGILGVLLICIRGNEE